MKYICSSFKLFWIYSEVFFSLAQYRLDIENHRNTLASCPGFSWDRVTFLLVSLYSAVLWIRNENDVNNILMFLVVSRQSRTFLLLMLAWPARRMGKWEGTQLGQLNQTDQRGFLFHVASCSLYELQELSREQQSLLRMGWVLFIGCDPLHLCITCFAHIIIDVIVIIIYSFAFQLNCLYLNPQVFNFPILLPIPLGRGRGEQVAVWCLVASWG